MKFSVLIPVYNTEKYLDECIQSVLDQTYQDFEIILVDDGSTDTSPQKCDEYKTQHPNLFKVIHQHNSGQLVSRINAIKAADGDYCIFLDSDDLLIEKALEIIYNQVVSKSLPDMIVYAFYYDREGKLEKSRTICECERWYQEKDVKALQKLFFTDILLNSLCTKAIKRELLLNNQYEINKFSSLRCAEDRLQSMWILDSISSAVYIDIPLYRYRLFSGSTTRTYTLDSIIKYNTVILYEEEKKFLQKWGFDSVEWIERFQSKYISYLVYVFDLFYLHVKKEDRKAVINYSWIKFLPDEIDAEKIQNNRFVSDLNKELALWILEKDLGNLRKFYFRKKTYKYLRKIKRKVFG